MSRAPAFMKDFTSVLTLSTGSMPAYCGKRKTQLDNGSLAGEYPEAARSGSQQGHRRVKERWHT